MESGISGNKPERQIDLAASWETAEAGIMADRDIARVGPTSVHTGEKGKGGLFRLD